MGHGLDKLEEEEVQRAIETAEELRVAASLLHDDFMEEIARPRANRWHRAVTDARGKSVAEGPGESRSRGLVGAAAKGGRA